MAPKTRVLFVRTNYDTSTAYTSAWTEPVITAARKHNHDVTKLDGPNATLAQFSSRLASTKPRFVCLNGHGTPEAFLGHEDVPLVDTTTASLLQETITFARACDCLAVLGPTAVAHGCTAFVGYAQPFVCPHNEHKYASHPLKDTLAAPIMQASNATPIALIKGSTVKDAIDASHRAASKEIGKRITSPDPDDNAILLALVGNDAALGHHGDPDAKL